MGIAPINIAITGNSTPLAKEVEKANKTIDKLQPPKGDALAESAKKTGEAYKKTTAEIQKTVAELYKLRAEMGKGAGDTSKLLAQLEKLKGQLRGVGDTSKGKPSETIKELAKEALRAAGIGGVNEKALGATVGGVNVGAVVGVVGAALAAGQIGANSRQTQRESGVSGSGFGNAIGGVQQLPVIKQLSEAAGEFGALFGLDTSTSDNAAALDQLTKNAKVYDDLRKSALLSAQANARVDRENARTLQSITDQGQLAVTGGDDAKRLAVEIAGRNAVQDAAARRDDTKVDARNNISDIRSRFSSDTDSLKKIISGRSGSKEADEAQQQLRVLEAERDRLVAEQNERIATADKAFTDQQAAIGRNVEQQIGVINGSLPDVKAMNDAFDGLRETVDTLGADSFDTLRKQFAALNPDASAIETYGKLVDEFEQRSKQIQGEQTTKGLEKQVGSAGLNGRDAALAQLRELGVGEDVIIRARVALDAIQAKITLADLQREANAAGLEAKDARLQQMRDAGLDENTIIQAKVILDTIEAKQKAKELADTIRDTQTQIAIEHEQDVLARIAIEVNAMKGLTDEQKAQLTAEKQRLALAKEANSLRESLKTPEDKLKDQIDQLKRLVDAGELTDDEASRGIEKARNDFIDSQKVGGPELLEAGSGQAQRAAYIAAGRVVDSANPMVREQKKTNEILQDIKNGRSTSEIADSI